MVLRAQRPASQPSHTTWQAGRQASRGAGRQSSRQSGRQPSILRLHTWHALGCRHESHRGCAHSRQDGAVGQYRGGTQEDLEGGHAAGHGQGSAHAERESAAVGLSSGRGVITACGSSAVRKHQHASKRHTTLPPPACDQLQSASS